MNVTPLKDGYALFHAGTKAFMDMEWRGLKIDLPYCESKYREMESDVNKRRSAIIQGEYGKMYVRKEKSEFNPDSNKQLATMLYDIIGIRRIFGNSVDEATLQKLKHPLCTQVLEMRKIAKAKETYIGAFMRNVDCDGILRPSFNLSSDDSTVCTYRSSSSNPNFQNIPARNIEVMNLVRRAIIPRKGYLIADFDFKGAEVGVGACYHKDKNMIAYVKDKSKDMHRDQAVKLFLLPQDEVTKQYRHASKNRYVFPQFYGSSPENCANALWEYIIETPELKKHMFGKGYKTLTDYTKHVETVSDEFWNKLFKGYTRWKYDWYDEYKKKGYFITHTGFICRGVMRFTQVCNFPIQGSAFHCLLWVLIELNKWLKKNKMKSAIVGQIHDSIVAEVWPAEFEAIREKVKDLLERELPKVWKWINVPLEMELEAAGVNESWNLKKKVA